jgi:hypothetical protein
LPLLLVAASWWAGAPAYANSFSVFPEVVRIQGPSPTSGGTGSLIGSRHVGNLLGLVFLATDHTLERVGPLETIGFGDLGAPQSNIIFQSMINPVVFSKGWNGTTDMSVIGVTVDLSLLPFLGSGLSLRAPADRVRAGLDGPLSFRGHGLWRGLGSG